MPRKPNPQAPPLAVVSADGRRDTISVPTPEGRVVVDFAGGGLSFALVPDPRAETPPGPRRRDAGGVEPRRK